jgi:glycosyltransferase involved in cell wall biosynthesis
MNILFVTDQFTPAVNGIVTQIITIREELQKRGHRVIVVAPKFAKDWVEKDKDVFRLNSCVYPFRKADRLIFPFNKKIENYLLKEEIDIVHNHLLLAGFLGVRVANKKHIPKVATFHTLPTLYTRYTIPWIAPLIDPITYLLTKKYFDSYDLVLCPSRKAVEELNKAKVKEGKALLFNNAINLSVFKNGNKETFLQKYSLDPNKPLLAMVGRIDPGKNFEFMVKAASKIRQLVPEIQIAIVGDGEEREKVKKLVNKLGLAEVTVMTGFISKELVASAYKAAKVSLFASTVDTLPTVLIEAAAAGNPLVGMNDSAIVDIIKNNENGFIVDTFEDFVDKTIEILKNEEQYQKFSEGSKKIAENFSIENYSEKLIKIYSDLIETYGRNKSD